MKKFSFLDYVQSKEQLYEAADTSSSIQKTKYNLTNYCYLTEPSLCPNDIIEVSWFYPNVNNKKMIELYSISVLSGKKIQKMVDPTLKINTTAYKFNKWLSNNANLT